MPPSVVRTPEEEKDWERAKSVVRAEYPGKESEDENGFFALAMTIYKSLRKGHLKTESVDWKAMLSLVPVVPTYEDKLELRVEAESLQPGDQVVVTTKIGRTMLSGSVTAADSKQVTILTGGDKLRSFPTELYNFLKVTVREDGDGIDEVFLGRVSNAPEATDFGVDPRWSGPLPITKPGTADDGRPAIKIISKYLGSDVRWANEVWSDLTSMGSVRTAKKHGLEPRAIASIVAELAAVSAYSE